MVIIMAKIVKCIRCGYHPNNTDPQIEVCINAEYGGFEFICPKCGYVWMMNIFCEGYS